MKATIYSSSKLNAINSIIQCYTLIIKSNIIILSHSISSQNRNELTIILRSSRKIFQRLYQYAVFILTSNFKKNELPNSSHITPIISQKNFDKESEINTRFEDSQLQDLSRFNFDTLFESFLISDKIFKKTATYRNFINKSNVYTDLHFDKVITKYTTFNNIITFSSKDKHRYELNINNMHRLY